MLPTMVRGIVDALRLRVPALPPDLAGILAGTRGPDASNDTDGARAVAATLAEALAESLTRDFLFVLDDVHELTGAPGPTAFLESLSLQAPQQLHLVLASRAEPPLRIDRLRGQGHVLDVDAGDLRLDLDEVTALVEAAGVTGSPDTVTAIRDACGGWPAAVRLAVEAVSRVPDGEIRDVLGRMPLPGGRLYAYLAGEVLALEDPAVQRLVRTLAPLPRFTPGLCEELGFADAAELLAVLARGGIFVEPHGRGAGSYTLTAPIREYALTTLPLPEDERRQVLEVAAAWLAQRGEPGEALALYIDAGNIDEAIRILTESGQQLLAAGALAALEHAFSVLPDERLDAGLSQLAGEVRQVRGDWDGAIACYERAAQAAQPLPCGLAWRLGLIHHLRGRISEALELYRAADETTGTPHDLALLLAWRASALWLRGDSAACRADAERAHAIATEAGTPQALAAAHTVLAMLAALDGDRGANDAHYLRALDYAERAGDVLQLIRVRTNRGSQFFEEGAFEESIEELDHALRLADLAGFSLFRALALSNRGDAHLQLGRLETAVADLEAARRLFEQLDSRLVSYPLKKLGDVYRVRGSLALARAAYEEAIRHAEEANDLQGLVPALSGAARVLAADDPEAATLLAERACDLGPVLGHVEAMLAAAWVALVRGDVDGAGTKIAEAAAVARSRRDRAGLAEALDLEALSTRDLDVRRRRLEESTAIWREIKNPIAGTASALGLAVVDGDQAAVADATSTLRALGAHGALSIVELLAPPATSAEIEIETLGRFRVLRHGEPIPATAWQSRKARDLVKILVARRGRPVPRDVLMEALWPNEDPARLSNRLSVALSTARAVLDPEKRYEAERYVVADRAAARIDLDHASVDLETFLAAAQVARAAPAGGDAEALVRRAEALYTGDFLEEDAYEEWALVAREEARAVYFEVLHSLADTARRSERHEDLARYARRVLERDAYDERAHLDLVSALDHAGRHGEARRAYGAYCARMEEIGVESTSFPGRPAPD
jgi:DNA-binding SARP family transcriptional activator/tetratricopeptide (TPR) repeat protein